MVRIQKKECPLPPNKEYVRKIMNNQFPMLSFPVGNISNDTDW